MNLDSDTAEAFRPLELSELPSEWVTRLCDENFCETASLPLQVRGGREEGREGERERGREGERGRERVRGREGERESQCCTQKMWQMKS